LAARSNLPPVEELPGCVRSPIEVTRVEWVADAFRRQIPPAPLFYRWRLEIDFLSEGLPVRLAAVLRAGSTLRYSRELEHDPPAERQRYRINVHPYDWDRGDEVGIGVQGTGASVTSARLKADPRAVVQPLVGTGERLWTGTVVDVADFEDLGLVAQVALIAAQDTKKDRTRWRIRSEPPEGHAYTFLWSGRRSGVAAVEAATANESSSPQGT
jgi:hypothetical protein